MASYPRRQFSSGLAFIILVTGSKKESPGNIFKFGLTKRRQMMDRVLQVCQAS